MFRKHRKFSSLIMVMILAFAVSSSFCLKFLTLEAMAAGNNMIENSQPIPSRPMLMTDAPAFETCSSHTLAYSPAATPFAAVNDAAPAVTSDNPSLSSDTGAGSGPVEDCCFESNHHANIIPTENNFSAVFGAAIVPPSVEIIRPQTYVVRPETAPLPPPQADALRSIIKRE